MLCEVQLLMLHLDGRWQLSVRNTPQASSHFTFEFTRVRAVERVGSRQDKCG
jgi:hypothetical protein